MHEAFFDPVAIGGAVGADAANGVLKPASFSLADGGSIATLGKIAWEPGRATVELEPSLSLAGHHADFIVPDGSVSLRLDFDDATETVDGAKRTLAWNVCSQPWESGDLLMLRISRSGEDLTGVTNDGPCNQPPEFNASSYTFSILETAAAASAVGSVLATDPDEDDTVSYSITGRNEDGKFAIDTGAGEITVQGALDYETTPEYTLIIAASDGHGGSATANVSIAVTGGSPPPAPVDLAATATHNSVTLTWRAPDGVPVTGYRILRRAAQSEDTLGHLADVAATVTTHQDADGIAADTRYIYRVLAMYDAVEGDSARVAVTTNPAP